MSNPFAFERTRHVTLPVLKQEVGQPRYVRVDTQVVEGKERQGTDGSKEKPARVMSVTCLETGEQGQMVLGTVLEGNLTEKYPDHSYVGKCFEFLKKDKPKGKRYHDYELYEIKDPGTQAKSLNPAEDKGKGGKK